MTNIKNFITLITGSKDTGLIIAKSEIELLSYIETIDNYGFKQSININDLTNFSKTYFVVNENLDKNIYDFIAQYSTGQIEIFDKNTMQSKIIFPDYPNSAFVLITTKNNLNKLKNKGFNLLSITGPTYQS